MGFLRGLFGSRKPQTFAPPSDATKSEIMLLAASCNYEGLARHVKSKNPHVRSFMIEALLFAGRTRSLGSNEFQMSEGGPFDDRAARLLIPLLKDSDPKVRQSTERALASLGSRNAEVAQALEDYRASSSAVE